MTVDDASEGPSQPLASPPAPSRRPMARPALAAIVLVLLAALAVLVPLLLRLTGSPIPARSPEKPASPVTFVKEFGNKDGSPLRNPLAVAVAGGRVFVAESDAGVVRVFSPEGEPVAAWRLPDRSDGATAYPSAVADLGDGRLGVVDLAGRRVFLLSLEKADFGKVLGVLGSAYTKTRPRRPTSLVGVGDHILVADGEDRVLKEYDLDGHLVRVLARKLEPRLTFVGGMALDGDRVVVSDSNAARVVSLPTTEGAPSVFPVRFTLPRGLCASPLGLAVADPFAHAVAVYAPSGKRVAVLSPPHAAAWAPQGIAWLESQRRFYVADPASGKVMVFHARAD